MVKDSAWKRYCIGDIIYSPFSLESGVFFIESGYVTASTIDDGGKKRIHLIYGPGTYFPLLSLHRGTPQRATYEALTDDVHISIMKQTDFNVRLDTEIRFCRDVLSKTVDQLALFADRVIDLQMTKLTEKLLCKLKVLASDHGVLADEYTQLPYKLRHHHLADMLGVERESVSRSLSSLKRDGLISIKDGYILVCR